MGGGIIIQQNSVVRTAVNDPSIYGSLSSSCKAEVDAISQKALTAWTDQDYAYMANMLTAARHC